MRVCRTAKDILANGLGLSRWDGLSLKVAFGLRSCTRKPRRPSSFSARSATLEQKSVWQSVTTGVVKNRSSAGLPVIDAIYRVPQGRRNGTDPLANPLKIQKMHGSLIGSTKGCL